jgi:dihydrofolate reductase
MLASLDRYVAAADGSLVMPAPKETLHWHFNEWMRRTAVALYGRRMYEVMRFWENWDKGPQASEVERDFAEAWRQTPKIVFSTTLTEVGPNARLVRGDVEAAVREVKSQTSGEVSASGPGLAASLSRLGLIDEYRLYLRPVVLGGGKPFFEARLPSGLKLLASERMPEDVVLLRYAPAG